MPSVMEIATKEMGFLIEAAQANMQYLPGPVYNVTGFGAVGDGVTDDTAKIQAAIDATDSGVVYLPRGTYILSDKLLATDKNISLVGAGIGATILKWVSYSVDTGIQFTNNSSDKFISVKDMTLVTEKAGEGTAITVVRSGEAVDGIVQNRTSPRASFNNLDIKGATNASTDGWLYGISCVDAMHITFENIHFAGYHAGNMANPITEAFMSFSGSNSPTEYIISNCWAFYCKDAIRVRETIEGVHVNNCNFVSVGDGIDWDSGSSDPLLALMNSHINAYNSCVRLSEVNQFVINGNLFYKRSDSIANGTGVHAINCSWGSIVNNTFVNTSASFNFDCVVFQGNTSNCLVSDNIFQSGTTAIWFQSGTSNCVQRNNHFGNITQNKVLDQSANNIKAPGLQAIVRRTTNFSVNNSTQTIMVWDNKFIDEFGAIDLVSQPTRITIPAGVSYVDIVAGVVWAANNTGERRIEIFKNGALLINTPKLIKQAVSNSSDSICINKVPVSAGDYFELRVYQSSGAALDVLTDTGTFMRIVVS